MTLYAATTNPGKLREFAASASGHGIVVEALPNLAAIPEPVEDAVTLMGNAELKAIAYSLAAPGLLVFADDSGLAVEALDGAPGVRSARYADDAGYALDLERNKDQRNKDQLNKDQRNNNLLLANLSVHPERPRAARFLCALALARDGEVLLRAEGSVSGDILTAPRGELGFGYDPLFLIPSLGLTLAELAAAQKWQLSHRGHAFRALLEELGRQPLS